MVNAIDASIRRYQLFLDNNASDTDRNDQFQKVNVLFTSFRNKTNTLRPVPYTIPENSETFCRISRAAPCTYGKSALPCQLMLNAWSGR